MPIVFETRATDSPYIESVTRGHTVGAGTVLRPAECNWHMVFVNYQQQTPVLMVGPWSTAGAVQYTDGAEILWIRLKLGVFMPHMPTPTLLNAETPLPAGAGRRSFHLRGTLRQFPDFENAETFVQRLVREDSLVCDPLVGAVLQGQPHGLAARTVRHRFVRATGLTHNHIFQVERAKRAAALLQQGWSIADTVFEAGYFDQPHLTRALKQWVGYTPAALVRQFEASKFAVLYKTACSG